jgi:hypothetical protein
MDRRKTTRDIISPRTREGGCITDQGEKQRKARYYGYLDYVFRCPDMDNFHRHAAHDRVVEAACGGFATRFIAAKSAVHYGTDGLFELKIPSCRR